MCFRGIYAFGGDKCSRYMPSLTDAQACEEMMKLIKAHILNMYPNLPCMLYCRNHILIHCYSIINYMVCHHDVKAFQCMKLLHDMLDKEKAPETHKLIYALFHIAYSYYFIQHEKSQKSTADDFAPSAPPGPKDPKGASLPPSENSEKVDKLHDRINELEQIIKKLQASHKEPWDKVIDALKNHQWQ